MKEWEDRHPDEECWFAYTNRPFIRPETYGIHCHILPSGLGGAGNEDVPAVIHGSVLISAAEVDGSLWPSQEANPYHVFQARRPDEEIDYGVLVYRGDIPIGPAVRALNWAFRSQDKLDDHAPQEALALAEKAARLAPGHLLTQWQLGDVAAACGKKDEARAAYMSAMEAVNKLDSDRRARYGKHLEDALKKL